MGPYYSDEIRKLKQELKDINAMIADFERMEAALPSPKHKVRGVPDHSDAKQQPKNALLAKARHSTITGLVSRLNVLRVETGAKPSAKPFMHPGSGDCIVRHVENVATDLKATVVDGRVFRRG